MVIRHRRMILVWVMVSGMFWLMACGSTGSGVAPPPTVPTEIVMNVKAIEANQTSQAEYVKVLDAQRSATQAAIHAQQLSAQVTAMAMQTREALNGTATRQALNEQATRQAQIVGVTATANAIAAQGTATMQSVRATATQQAAQFTATAHAQNMAATATTQNLIVQQTQASASTTALANVANAQATQVSAFATATANAADAKATRTSADATATVIIAQALAAQEKAEWDKRLEAGRAIASFLGLTLVMIACAVIVGFGVIRFIDAGVLRARVFRDKTGSVFVIGEKDKHGRQNVFIPGRSPGAVLNITPPDEKPLLVEGQVIDEETTKRDQAISLMIAATHGKGDSDDVLRELTEGTQIQFVDEPPVQLVPGDVKQLIDGDWERLGDGKSNEL